MSICLRERRPKKHLEINPEQPNALERTLLKPSGLLKKGGVETVFPGRFGSVAELGGSSLMAGCRARVREGQSGRGAIIERGEQLGQPDGVVGGHREGEPGRIASSTIRRFSSGDHLRRDRFQMVPLNLQTASGQLNASSLR